VLIREDSGPLSLTFDGVGIGAREGESIASALLAVGFTTTRTTAISGEPRGPFCMMGACFECLAVVDGRPGVQTCMTAASDGMRIERQDGVRALFGER
jgi:predicted molibdopterin-dependent oxidoreductase YjgC